MGKDKVVEMSLQGPKHILQTYKKLKELLKNSEDFLYVCELSEDEISIVEKVSTAAYIIDGLGLRSGNQYMEARARVEFLIGNYEYPVDLYRTYVRVCADLAKYKLVYQSFEVESELEHKLA